MTEQQHPGVSTPPPETPTRAHRTAPPAAAAPTAALGYTALVLGALAAVCGVLCATMPAIRGADLWFMPTLVLGSGLGVAALCTGIPAVRLHAGRAQALLGVALAIVAFLFAAARAFGLG